MECSIQGCIKAVFRKGKCCSHYEEERRRNAPRCSVVDCNNPVHGRGLCNKHYRLELRREKPVCSVEGCGRAQQANGLCGSHNQRKMRHGHLEPTRPHDWGGKEKHPLYHTWGGVKKKRGLAHIEQEWLDDFWIFVKDVGEKPSPRHTFRLKDKSKGYVKENIYWKEPVLEKVKAESKIEYQAKYIKRMRENDPRKFANYAYKRHYGITLDQYELMLESQDGVCLICGNEESAVDRRTQQPRRFAVDHCHRTGEVRGLLCHKCNTSLGGFKDSVDILKSAIKYLERFSKDSDKE